MLVESGKTKLGYIKGRKQGEMSRILKSLELFIKFYFEHQPSLNTSKNFFLETTHQQTRIHV